MNIIFPSVDDNYIRNKVESGYYTNATELVRDAVRRMRENDANLYRLLSALAEGDEDAENGRITPYTPSLLDEIDQEARQALKEGKGINPDVID